MREGGRKAVEAAKGDGRWERAYSGAANLDEMRDLVEAVRGGFCWCGGCLGSVGQGREVAGLLSTCGAQDEGWAGEEYQGVCGEA
jgi:hypothetical protein